VCVCVVLLTRGYLVLPTAQEERERKLAAIRAQRAQQAANNRMLAQQRKRKIDEMNAASAAAAAAHTRPKEPAAPKPSVDSQLEAMRRMIAAQEAQLAELRRQQESTQVPGRSPNPAAPVEAAAEPVAVAHAAAPEPAEAAPIVEDAAGGGAEGLTTVAVD